MYKGLPINTFIGLMDQLNPNSIPFNWLTIAQDYNVVL